MAIVVAAEDKDVMLAKACCARFSNVVSLISVGYWPLDMILSFFMPYERDGVTISDCRMTSLHYV